MCMWRFGNQTGWRVGFQQSQLRRDARVQHMPGDCGCRRLTTMASSNLAPTSRSTFFSPPADLSARSRLWLEYQEKFSAFH
jgi:hypothetical protein